MLRNTTNQQVIFSVCGSVNASNNYKKGGEGTTSDTFNFCDKFRLSARISDFENVLLMVHVVGYMLAPQAHGTQLFFFSNARF